MKKLVLCFLVSASMIACNSKQNETTSNTDDAAMADFKENSKIIADGFENFSKNDIATFSAFLSDTVKAHGPAYGEEAPANKTIHIQRLQGFHTILSNIKANDIKFLPSVVVALIKAAKSGLCSLDNGVGTQINTTSESEITL